MAAGSADGYALKTDGSIVAWGYNGDGETSGVPSGTDLTSLSGSGRTGYALNAVPEPASLTLLALGGLGLISRFGRQLPAQR